MRLLVLTGMTGAPSTMSPKRLYDISIFSICSYIRLMLHLCPSRAGNHVLLPHAAEVKPRDPNYAMGRR